MIGAWNVLLLIEITWISLALLGVTLHVRAWREGRKDLRALAEAAEKVDAMRLQAPYIIARGNIRHTIAHIGAYLLFTAAGTPSLLAPNVRPITLQGLILSLALLAALALLTLDGVQVAHIRRRLLRLEVQALDARWPS